MGSVPSYGSANDGNSVAASSPHWAVGLAWRVGSPFFHDWDLQQQIQKRIHSIMASGDVCSARAVALSRFHQAPRLVEHDYRLDLKVLGTGGSGVTRLAWCNQAGPQSTECFAVKEVSLAVASSTEQVEQIRSEASIHLQLDHPHIARLFDVYETESSIHLVMECMEGGELLQHLEECTTLTELETANIVSQILLALNYIHVSGFIHCDLKLENIMFDKGRQCVKIIDFGSSQRSNTQGRLQPCCNTLPYTSPEMLAGDCTSKCDLWSLGVITFALLSGQMPFSGSPSAQRQKIMQNKYSLAGDRWKTVSQQGKHFVKCLLEAAPEKRFSAQEALEHTWLLQQHKRTQQLINGQPMVEAPQVFSKASLLQPLELDSALHDDFVMAKDESQHIIEMPMPDNSIGIKDSGLLASMLSGKSASVNDGGLLSAFSRLDQFTTADDVRSVFGEAIHEECIEDLRVDASFVLGTQITFPECADMRYSWH